MGERITPTNIGARPCIVQGRPGVSTPASPLFLTTMSTHPAATVRPADSVPFTALAVGRGTALQVLVGPALGETSFVLRRFRMDAGGGMPLHTNLVEHQQYVLRGRARLRIGSAWHEVRADDTTFIPAGVPHAYEVLEGPFEFLCVVPDRPDTVTLVDAPAAP